MKRSVINQCRILYEFEIYFPVEPEDIIENIDNQHFPGQVRFKEKERKMKNKKIGAKLLAALLCASLVFPATVYAAETDGDSQVEIQAEIQPGDEKTEASEDKITETPEDKAVEVPEDKTAETPAADQPQKEESALAEEDVMPTIGAATPTLGADFVYAPITVGSGKYKASKLKVEMMDQDTGLDLVVTAANSDHIVEINENILSEGLSLYIMFNQYEITSGKAGDFKVRVTFLDENGNEICRDENSVKVHVDEDWSIARNFERGSNGRLKWDGVSDLVFKFDPGYGLGAADRWHAGEGWGSCAERMHIHPYQGATDYTIYNETDYELDLNGTIIIKGSALRRIANEDKNFGNAEYYSFTAGCQVKSGSQPAYFGGSFTYDRNDGTTPVKEVELPTENTVIPADEMASLVEQNQVADVVIHNPDGVDFTFAKGSMMLINGKESYDFGTTLITDAKDSGITGVSASEIAFRLNFNYSGELPGKATISISLGKDCKWIGKTLYYSLIDSGKIKEQIYKNVVDENGVYTVEQNHCSDYVATTKDMQKTSPSSKTENTSDKQTNPSSKAENTSDKQVISTPKTGDTSLMFLFMALVLVSGAAVFGVWGVKRRLK